MVNPVPHAMPRYVALLRAINVGGHTVRMDALRAHFASLGYRDVSTYIASGNVLFTTNGRSAAPIERRIATTLEEAFGFAVAAFVRTPVEMRAAALHAPWRDIADTEVLSVGFLSRALTADESRTVRTYESPNDEFALNGRALYWRRRGGINDSKFTLSKFERALRVEATFRNVTTVRALADLLEAPPK